MNIPVTNDNIILGQSPSLNPLSDSNGGGSGSGIGGAIGFIIATTAFLAGLHEEV